MEFDARKMVERKIIRMWIDDLIESVDHQIRIRVEKKWIVLTKYWIENSETKRKQSNTVAVYKFTKITTCTHILLYTKNLSFSIHSFTLDDWLIDKTVFRLKTIQTNNRLLNLQTKKNIKKNIQCWKWNQNKRKCGMKNLNHFWRMNFIWYSVVFVFLTDVILNLKIVCFRLYTV